MLQLLPTIQRAASLHAQSAACLDSLICYLSLQPPEDFYSDSTIPQSDRERYSLALKSYLGEFKSSLSDLLRSESLDPFGYTSQLRRSLESYLMVEFLLQVPFSQLKSPLKKWVTKWHSQDAGKGADDPTRSAQPGEPDSKKHTVIVMGLAFLPYLDILIQPDPGRPGLLSDWIPGGPSSAIDDYIKWRKQQGGPGETKDIGRAKFWKDAVSHDGGNPSFSWIQELDEEYRTGAEIRGDVPESKGGLENHKKPGNWYAKGYCIKKNEKMTVNGIGDIAAYLGELSSTKDLTFSFAPKLYARLSQESHIGGAGIQNLGKMITGASSLFSIFLPMISLKEGTRYGASVVRSWIFLEYFRSISWPTSGLLERLSKKCSKRLGMESVPGRMEAELKWLREDEERLKVSIRDLIASGEFAALVRRFIYGNEQIRRRASESH